MITEEKRSYEVSLWTLQDEFITVLKWSDVEQQGRIQEPQMVLNVDGTRTFNFSIPMYLYYYVKEPEPHMEKKENPIWYNTRNGNLMASMRKIKVIFNKGKTLLPTIKNKYLPLEDLLNDDTLKSDINWRAIWKEAYVPFGYYGNVDLWNRKIIPASAFTDAGYNNFSGDYGTLYSSASTVENIVVAYTPVLADGTVKTSAQMNTYLSSLGSTVDDILSNDAAADNLILGCFIIDDYGTETAAVNAANAFTKNLHNIQEQWDILRYYNNWFDAEDIDENDIFSGAVTPIFSYYDAAEKSKNTFEFLITKVTEVHEKDELTCNVETEGLAFNELGKIGYKCTLNLDEVELDEKNLQKTEGIGAQIHTTVDYWAKKINLTPYIMTDIGGDPNIWQYIVSMNWDSFGAHGVHRCANKVYEEEYTSSWQINSNLVKPKSVESCKEKERIIDAKESNIYNITQTIAETFEIFCRYEYGYDENYHIISKKVIFYNNFIAEDEGFSSITYPYDAQSISRNMDSTNLTTKLYVQSSDTDDTVMGSNSISLSNANKTKEDYLLDFDYLYTINGINDEQYAAIKTYETDILNHNNTIIPLQENCNAISKRLIDLKAEQKIAAESVELDDKQTDLYKKKLEAYDKIDQMVDGKIRITETAPKLKVLITEDAEKKTYSLNLGDQDKGIDAGSVKVFKTWNSATGKCFGQFVNYSPKFDTKDNILIGLEHLQYAPTSFNNSDIDGTGKAYILSKNSKTPPTNGWTEVSGSFPATSSFTNTQKAETPFYWKNEYTVYKNGYIHNVYTMECLNNAAAIALNVKKYVIKKEPIYYYKSNTTPPTVPTSEVTTSATTLNTWTKGLRNYESGINCFITYQYQYRVFITTEVLNGNQGISSASTTPSSDIVYEWIPSAPVIDSKYNAQPSSSYVYVTYDYFPKLYYDKLIEYWSNKSKADGEKSADLLRIIGDNESDPKTGLYKDYDDAVTALNNALAAKQETIRKFEQMMGPALREGYWTPEDYSDYGDTYYKSQAFGNSYSNDASPASDATDAIISWDSLLFDDEETSYYESGTSRTHINYPCINLEEVYGSAAAALTAIKALLDKKGKNEGTPGFIYSDSNCRNLSGVTTSINNADMPNTINDNVRDPKYVRLFALDSEAIPAFGVVDGRVVPILILTGAKQLESTAITKMKRTISDNNDSKGGNPVIGLFNYIQNNNGTITINITGNPHAVSNTNSVWITPSKIVYPRIRIRSDAIQTTENKLFVSYGDDTILTNNEDYKVAFRTNTTNNKYYTETCITLKNHVIFGGGDLGKFATIKYTLSNANTIIYLDAIEVLKENSIPKVAYEVSVNVLNESLIRNLYDRLTQILMINDAELKFQNVFGYISQVELNLDAPWEDKIEVKNYKTKFEDLFSTIVAQTEAMKKNANAFFSAVAGEITLAPNAVQETINKNKEIFDAYRDSGFDSSEVVQAKLSSIAKEIGLILGAADQSLDRLYGLTLENANILSEFIERVAEDLTPHVYYGVTPPDTARTGDIFYQTDPETGEVIGHWLGNTNGGYTKTFDGQLSEITGASMNIDANKGSIELLSSTKMDLRTGGDLYIAANENINIVGNKSVNIGGGAINIASLATADKGISLVAVEESEALISAKVYELLLSKIKKSNNYVETDFTNNNGQNRAFAVALDSIKSINGSNYRFNFGDGIIYEVAKTSLEDSETFSYVKAYKWLSNKVSVTSLVDIKPKQIMMKSSNIIMKSNGKILFVASDGTKDGTTGLQISAETGMFLGSGKGITLFAGSSTNDTLINYDEATQNITLSTGAVIGSTLQMKPNYFIFGTASLSNNTNVTNGTVMHLTDKRLIIATKSDALQVYNTGELTSDSQSAVEELNISYNKTVAGAEIAHNKIGLATLDSYSGDNTYNIANLMLMNNEGLLLGTVLVKKSDESVHSPQTGHEEVSPGDNDTITDNIYTHGSYVAITPSLVEIGSLSNLYINTNNFKLQTDSYKIQSGAIVKKTTLDNTILAIGTSLQNITSDVSYTNGKFKNGNTELNPQPDVQLLLNKNGLYIKGTVYATSGSFTGDVNASSFIATGNNGKFIANSQKFGLYKTDNSNILTFSGTTLTVADELTLSIRGNLSLSADNISLASSGSGNYTVFSLRTKSGSTYTDYLKYTSNGQLTIKAESITLGTGSTGLKLTDSSIKLDISSNSHIYIDNNGIDMLGRRIKINNKEVWARDDILIVGQNEEDEETAISNAGIDQHKTDFVVIKPYYDAKIIYKYQPVYSIRAESGSSVIEIPQTTSEALSFGNGASWYRYQLSGVIHRSSSETQSYGALITVILSNNRDMTSSISFSGNVDTGNSTIWFTIDSGNLSGQNAVNLCGEGKLIYMKVYGQYVYDNVTDLTLLCTSATSTSKVPCTVYYYPKLPNN